VEKLWESARAARNHRQRKMLRGELLQLRQWGKKTHCQIMTSPKLRRSRQHQKVSGAACIVCCHCKRTLPLRSRWYNIISRAMGMFACSCPSFTVSWTLLSCCGVMPNTVSFIVVFLHIHITLTWIHGPFRLLQSVWWKIHNHKSPGSTVSWYVWDLDYLLVFS
jgi:hypothetical protein